jgi:eukaryotic-like serine/threonine-protein kinase
MPFHDYSSLFSRGLDLVAMKKEENVVQEEIFEFETETVDVQGHVIERQTHTASQYVEDLRSDITLEMVAIPGGTFLMGSPDAEVGHNRLEQPQHQVTVAPFYMSKYPVTQAQWEAVMEALPTVYEGPQYPVRAVSWRDAGEFCEQLSRRIKKRRYRLPSEAQWEYACRAGTTTPFYFGATLTPELANYNGNYPYAAEPTGVYRKQTTAVGRFPPNAFGLYDMHGNVWEWCADPWHGNYIGAPTDGSAWQTGGDANLRILRGGAWSNLPLVLRSACRLRLWQGLRPGNWGIRLVSALS